MRLVPFDELDEKPMIFYKNLKDKLLLQRLKKKVKDPLKVKKLIVRLVFTHKTPTCLSASAF